MDPPSAPETVRTARRAATGPTQVQPIAEGTSERIKTVKAARSAPTFEEKGRPFASTG